MIIVEAPVLLSRPASEEGEEVWRGEAGDEERKSVRKGYLLIPQYVLHAVTIL